MFLSTSSMKLCRKFKKAFIFETRLYHCTLFIVRICIIFILQFISLTTKWSNQNCMNRLHACIYIKFDTKIFKTNCSGNVCMYGFVYMLYINFILFHGVEPLGRSRHITMTDSNRDLLVVYFWLIIHFSERTFDTNRTKDHVFRGIDYTRLFFTHI